MVFIHCVFCAIHIAAYRIIAGSTALPVDLNILQLIQKGISVAFWRRLDTYAEFIINRSKQET